MRISSCSRRRALPKVLYEASPIIDRLYTKHHPQWGADIDCLRSYVRKLGHHASATFELDHSVIVWRVWRIGQIISRKGKYSGPTVRQRVVLLVANRWIVL